MDPSPATAATPNAEIAAPPVVTVVTSPPAPADTDLLYASLAQISATVVAILGGFLLTYGLAQSSTMRRARRRFLEQELELTMAENDELIARRQAPQAPNGTARPPAVRRLLLVAERTPGVRGLILRKRRRRLEQTLARLEKEEELLVERRSELLAARDELDAVLIQLALVARGMLWLAVLALVGIAIPLAQLPRDRWGGVVLFLTLLVLFLIGCYIGIVATSFPYAPRRRSRFHRFVFGVLGANVPDLHEDET